MEVSVVEFRCQATRHLVWKRITVTVLDSFIHNLNTVLTNAALGLRSQGTTSSCGNSPVIIALAANQTRPYEIVGSHALGVLEPSDCVEGEPWRRASRTGVSIESLCYQF